MNPGAYDFKINKLMPNENRMDVDIFIDQGVTIPSSIAEKVFEKIDFSNMENILEELKNFKP